MIDNFWDSHNHDWWARDSIGAARGLLISWDKHLLSLTKVESSDHWLWCKGTMVSGEILNIVNVYGPHDSDGKPLFWNDLRKIHFLTDEEPICMMGDFNSIRSKEDKENCVYNNRDSMRFNNFLEETGLIELQGSNFTFTWFGPKDKRSRSNRVVVNELWISSHSWKVIAGHRRNLDYRPLILASDITNWGPNLLRPLMIGCS